MTAYMVIAFPSIRPGCDIILSRIRIDYQIANALTVEEKERVNDKLAYWLYTIHYPQIIAVGKEPMIYVEIARDEVREIAEEFEFENEMDYSNFI